MRHKIPKGYSSMPKHHKGRKPSAKVPKAYSKDPKGEAPKMRGLDPGQKNEERGKAGSNRPAHGNKSTDGRGMRHSMKKIERRLEGKPM
jgi:hypothetical protein